jgi:hypothetical protein
LDALVVPWSIDSIAHRIAQVLKQVLRAFRA